MKVENNHNNDEGVTPSGEPVFTMIMLSKHVSVNNGLDGSAHEVLCDLLA